MEAGKDIKILFLYFGVVLALFVASVMGLSILYTLIDYFVRPDFYTWDFFKGDVFNKLPVLIPFFLVSFGSLIMLTRLVRCTGEISKETMYHRVSQEVITLVSAVSLITILIAVALLLKDFFEGAIFLENILKIVSTIGVGAMIYYFYRGGFHSKHDQQQKYITVIAVVLAIGIVCVSTVVINPLQRQAVLETYATLDYVRTVHIVLSQNLDAGEALPQEYNDSEAPTRYSYGRKRQEARYESLTYEKTGATTFTLCADFAALPRGITLLRYPYARYEILETGEQCFDLTAFTFAPDDQPYY